MSEKKKEKEREKEEKKEIERKNERVGKRKRDWCNKSHGMCYPVCGMMDIKEPLLLIRKSSSLDILSCYLSGPLPYVRRHITVNKMC